MAERQLLARQSSDPATGKAVGQLASLRTPLANLGNTKRLGLENVAFARSGIDDLPLEDGTVDIAITNGVFNLCPGKPRVLAEVFRVLRPAGRLQMADIFLHDDVTPDEVASKGSWSG